MTSFSSGRLGVLFRQRAQLTDDLRHAHADALSRQLHEKETEIADLIGALWAASQSLLSADTIRQLNDHLGAQARAAAQFADATIGIHDQMHDTPARHFAASLYSGLAFGNSVKRAFHQACAVIGDGPHSVMPQLFVRHGIDPHMVVLVRPEEEEGGTP